MQVKIELKVLCEVEGEEITAFLEVYSFDEIGKASRILNNEFQVRDEDLHLYNDYKLRIEAGFGGEVSLINEVVGIRGVCADDVDTEIFLLED